MNPIRRRAQGRQAVQGSGAGVLEIVLRRDAEAYRTVLAVQLGKKISCIARLPQEIQKGAATPQFDVDLIKRRRAEAREGEA